MKQRRRWLLLGALLLLSLLLRLPTLVAIFYNNLGSLSIERSRFASNASVHAAQIEQARTRFQAGIRWGAPTARLHTNLATLYINAQEITAAERALRRATELAPHDRRAQFQLGQVLALQGKFDAALAAWRAADAAQYFVQQGQALARDGKFEDAVRYYERALLIQPDLYEGYEYLGRALLRLGLKEEALNAFSSAVVLEPETSAHRYLLQAEIHIAREEWQAAVAAYQQAAALAPKDPAPHYEMGLILQRDPTSEERALAHFRYALRLNPDHVAARLALGQLYAKRGNCEEAISALSPLFVSGFSEGVRTQAQAIAGRCLMDQGHPREALVYLEQVVALNPQSVPHRCALADAYAQVGRYHDAIETYLQVLEIKPDNARARQALEALGWVEP